MYIMIRISFTIRDCSRNLNSKIRNIRACLLHYTGWSKKWRPWLILLDNFGKSTPILTILSVLVCVTTRNSWCVNIKLRRPPHLNYVATLPYKTNSIAKINATCSFYWLYCSIDSHEIKAIAQPRLLLEEITVFDMPTAILDNKFKTTTPFIDATVNETFR